MSKSKHDDLVAFVPLRFHEAFKAGEISGRQYALGCYLAAECFLARPASGGIPTVRLSFLGVMFGGVSDDTISRDLRGMEPQWIECEVSDGSRDGWRIGLTGLASPPEPPHHLRTTSAKDPPVLRRSTSARTSASERPDDGATPHGESDAGPISPPHEPPQERSSETDTITRTKTRTRTLGFEKKREALGPVPGSGENENPPLLGEDGFEEVLLAAFQSGRLTDAQALARWEAHKLARGGRP